MNRIERRFADLGAAGRKALIPYITAGDPAPDATVALMHALVAGGADMLEIGVPFSDPMADGPVIQAACERALKHGVSLRQVLGMIAEFRREDADTPVVLMGYLNPIEAMGYTAFADAAAGAGVDGVIMVDMTAEEIDEVLPMLRARDLASVCLVAPTTSEARMHHICEVARGYIYYVSLKGVTGSASIDVGSIGARIESIRRHSGLPVAVGFGIRDANTAARVASVADGIVVGSALVGRIAEHLEDRPRMRAEVIALLRAMRAAMDGVDVREESGETT